MASSSSGLGYMVLNHVTRVRIPSRPHNLLFLPKFTFEVQHLCMKKSPLVLESFFSKEDEGFDIGLIDQFILLFLFWYLWVKLGLNLGYARTMIFCFRHFSKSYILFFLGSEGWFVITGLGILGMFLIEITKWYFIVRHLAEE